VALSILLLGGTGQVGFELRRSLAVLGAVAAPGRAQCDLSRPDSLRRMVRDMRPGVIVNAAAHTDVEAAEREPQAAMLANAAGPAVLAEEAARAGALLVQYSSDYVFDGAKPGPYVENDPVAPLNQYGRSKAEGERAVREACPRHLILRTGWVFGVHGGNFLKTVLRLAGERDELEVVDDQLGAPTPASLVADATAHLVARHVAGPAGGAGYPYGTYHLAAAGATTWHAYAGLVVARARQAGWPLRLVPEAIRTVPASSRGGAARPAQACLDTSRLRAAFGLALPSWQDGVGQVLDVLLAARPPGAAPGRQGCAA